MCYYILKGLWVRLCKWQLSLSNKIESFILINHSVEDFNFGCNKIVQPKKGECSLATTTLLMVLGIVIKLLLSWASTFFPICNHFFSQPNKFFYCRRPLSSQLSRELLGLFYPLAIALPSPLPTILLILFFLPSTGCSHL